MYTIKDIDTMHITKLSCKVTSKPLRINKPTVIDTFINFYWYIYCRFKNLYLMLYKSYKKV